MQNPIDEMDLVDITNMVYEEGYTGEEMTEFTFGYQNEDIQYFEKNLVAGVSRQWVDEVLDKTDGSCEVLPMQFYDEYISLMEKGLWVEARDLLVNVRYGMVYDKIEKWNAK